MKKTILALLLVLSFAAAYDLRGNNFLSNTSPSQRNFEFVDESCSHAVKSFNRGIRQLVWDVRAQSNKWVVYADLDALDEMSYYLTNSCSDDDFQLTSKLGLSLTRPEQQACTDLMEIVDSLLERKRTEEFRGGYQAGIALSQQALELGQNIADGCKIRLLAKEQEAQSSKEESQAEEQDESSDDDDDSDENQKSDQDSDDDTNEESDENDDGVQGIHIGVVRERNGRKEKYTINVKRRDHGEPEVSVRRTVAGEEEEAVSDWDLSDWNNEEWNNAEWANEELAPGRWNNEEWNNAEWANEEWAIGEWSDSEWSDSDNEWSTEEWNDEENEEWGNEEWNNEEGSDESSDSSDEFPFFYTVNPNAKTDSGNYWRDGGYKRYYGGNDGGKGPNFGDFYWAI